MFYSDKYNNYLNISRDVILAIKLAFYIINNYKYLWQFFSPTNSRPTVTGRTHLGGNCCCVFTMTMPVVSFQQTNLKQSGTTVTT